MEFKVGTDCNYRYLIDTSKTDELKQLLENADKAVDALRDFLLIPCGADLKGCEDHLFKCRLAEDTPRIAEVCELLLYEIYSERVLLRHYKEDGGLHPSIVYEESNSVLKVIDTVIED